MKHLILILFSISTLSACIDNNNKKTQILLSITNECIADVRLFDTQGNQLIRKHYNCQEAQILIFDIQKTGPFILYAETPQGKKQKKLIHTKTGTITETTIDFP